MVKYFTPEEVAIHNCAEDCWVIIYDNVYDITLGPSELGELIQPLLKNAGMSPHWFNEKTKDVKTYIDLQRISPCYTYLKVDICMYCRKLLLLGVRTIRKSMVER